MYHPPSNSEGERTLAKPNDLLLSITAQIGAVGIVPDNLGESYVNQHTALIRLRKDVTISRWVAYNLISVFGKDQCRLSTNGGTKVGLTLNDVRCLWIYCPPIEEQRIITNAIETYLFDIDVKIRNVDREISLLREYRTRLVADVVTGKLDVREAAEGLPDLEEATASPDTEAFDEDLDVEAEMDAAEDA
jgi:type I restriction enzyme, S subunit